MRLTAHNVTELIDAILAANQPGAEAFIIDLVENFVYTLTGSTLYSADGDNGLPSITGKVTINGNGATIERQQVGSPRFRILHIGAGGVVELKGLTIRGGHLDVADFPDPDEHPSGAGIYNSGALSLVGCNVSENILTGQGASYGGGICCVGETWSLIENSTITENEAVDGAGLFSGYHNTTVRDSSFSLNTAIGGGGAISLLGGTAEITHCTFSQNTAYFGGAIENDAATLKAFGCVFENNGVTGPENAGSSVCCISWHTTTLRYNHFLSNEDFSVFVIPPEEPPEEPPEDPPEDPEWPNADAALNWWGAGDGPSGTGTGSGDSIGEHVDYLPFLTSNGSAGIGPRSGQCIFHETEDSFEGPNPISLYLGEKRHQETDLSLNTPVGPLAFVRSYRQNQRNDPQYAFMGLGWTHSHHASLKKPDGSDPTVDADVLVLHMPEGGAGEFYKTASGHHVGGPGSTSVIDWNQSIQRFVLTTPGKEEYRFGTEGKLRLRRWPNTEEWSYNYSPTTGKLDYVDDGYGRRIQFGYYPDNHPDVFIRGQLRHVGDQNATGLGTDTPQGVYVEFDYLDEKQNGQPVAQPRALLHTVKDVRGQTWTYDYYGQDAGENNGDQWNFLTERRSPEVQAMNDEYILLEKLAYTTSGATIEAITQERGAWESTPTAPTLKIGYAFHIDGGNGVTETTETIVVADKTTTYRFSRGVHIGSEDPAGNATGRVFDNQFRPGAQTDPNERDTWLGWSGDGKHLQKVTDALLNETRFEYNPDDTLGASDDAEGRKTAYTYGDANNPRLPTLVKVIDADGTTVLRWQRFTYDSKGRTVTEETLDPADATGDTVFQRTTRTYHPSGDGNGLLHTVTQEDLTDTYNDVTTTYLYDTFGRVVQTNQSSTFGSCTKARTVYDPAGNVVASLCNFEPGTSDPIYPETVAEAQALRQRLYDDQDPDHYTDPNTNRLTIYVYDELGRRVETVNNAEDPYERAARTVYDALGRVVRAVQGYDPAGVDNNVAQWTWDETDGRWEDKNGVAIPHGDDYSRNLITDTAYNERGMVRMGRDTLGNVTLYGYDDAGRLVKTVANASIPGYDNSYGPNGDPDLSDYVVGDDLDRDIVTEQAYDAAGNAVKVVDVGGRAALTGNDALNRPVKAIRSASQPDYDVRADLDLSAYEASDAPDADLVAVTVYDAMGRAIRSRDAAGSWTLYGYDALGRQVKAIRSAGDPEYDITSDPDLSAYEASDDPDRDLVTLTAYDDHGRTRFVADEAGAQTWYVYDGFGRQVLVVRNYYDDGNIDENPDNWVWDPVDGRWEDGSGVAIPPGEDHDRNIISQTVYDDDGRVQHTRDALGQVTWNVYDGAGRQVRAVRNYDPTGLTYADPADWVWVTDHWEDGDGHTVVRGDNDDLNLITETAYDDQGRMYTATDARRNLTRSVYDALGRRVRTIQNWVDNGEDPADWVWDENDARWEKSDGTPIDHGDDHDQNLVSDTAYDLAGRVSRTRDAAGVETRYFYDAAGRRVQTIANYVDGVFESGRPDEDVTTETVYNKAGQVLATIDARGTRTAFTYDAAGRRLTVTGAAETPLAAVSYTCYDKGGRVLRTITNWIAVEGAPSPDERNENGDWLFAPETHGPFEDRDLVTAYGYDAAGRRTLAVQNVYFDGVIDTDLGHWAWSAANARWEDGSGHPIPATLHGDRNIVTQTVYDKAGQVVTERDPLGVVTRFVYDGLRRLRRVVQNWVDNGEDPADWVWDANDARWEKSDGTPIDHGDANDTNVIVVVELDLVGRRTSLRDPRGNETTDAHDALGRRTALTNPLDETWATAYSDLAGGTRTELTDPNGDVTRRDTDRVGRLKGIAYLDEDPKVTPDVEFVYDLAGNRVRMTESDGRETEYAYDAMRRLVAVTFDDGQAEQTVQYAYDAGGLRTRLTLPDGLTVTYTYDVRGQLVSLTDWDRQTTRFAYDLAGRLIAATRSSGLRSRYAYDGAGRLRRLRHSAGRKTLGHFAFEVDARGNRTRAFECVPHPGTSQTTIAYDDDAIAYRGTWADDAPYKVTTEATASLQVTCFGGAEDHLTLTLGKGPDHGICDVYVGNSFWQSFDLYSAAPDDRAEEIPVTGEGPHLIEVRNRAEKDTRSTGYKLRFKSLVVDRTYDLHTIEYAYDALSRLLSADYHPGANLDATPFRQYEYTYDLAGNRTQEIVTVGGTPTTTSYTYNDANQLTSDGVNTYTYDDNGNLLGDGVNPYTWDRANRLLSFGGAAYKYDGLGNRFEQTVNSIVTKYLLDTQPGLAVVLESAIGNDVTRFVHGPRGLHAQQQPNGDWVFPVQDALGSIRGVADESLNMLESRLYAPYGSVQETHFAQDITESVTPYGFTGEPMDENDLVYLRARYLNSGLGVFASHDPVCGEIKRVMSLNGYSWVEGNVINAADPSGEIFERITRWDKCASAGRPYQQGKACGEVPTGRAKQELDLRDEDMVLLALNIPFETQVHDRKVQNEEMVQRLQTIVWLSRVYRHKITVSEALTGSRNYDYGAIPEVGQTSWREEFTRAFIGVYRRPPDPEELRNPSPAVVQALWEDPITPVDDTSGLCKVVEKAIEEWGNEDRFWHLYYFGHWEDSDLEKHFYQPYEPRPGVWVDPLHVIDTTTGDRMRHVCCDMLYVGRRYGEWQTPGIFVGYRGSKKTIFASSHLVEVVNYPAGVNQVPRDKESMLADYQSACDPGHRWYRDARPMEGVPFAGSETDVCREECKDGQGLWWFPNPECSSLA